MVADLAHRHGYHRMVVDRIEAGRHIDDLHRIGGLVNVLEDMEVGFDRMERASGREHHCSSGLEDIGFVDCSLGVVAHRLDLEEDCCSLAEGGIGRLVERSSEEEGIVVGPGRSWAVVGIAGDLADGLHHRSIPDLTS